MSTSREGSDAGSAHQPNPQRHVRADAQRNLETVLRTAKEVFASAGVDVSMREIASRAGVGVGTLYRHFPRRIDLVAAVFHQEMDACAESAAVLAAKYPPFEALASWMQQFTALVVTKRGLAAALHSGDPVFDGLPQRRDRVVRPAFLKLFHAAVLAGEVRADVDPEEFLDAVSSLCIGAYDARPDFAQRMVALFVDALRCKAP